MLNGHAKWEPVKLPEPLDSLLIWNSIPGGQKEITTLINAPLEARVLVWTGCLCNNTVCNAELDYG